MSASPAPSTPSDPAADPAPQSPGDDGPRPRAAADVPLEEQPAPKSRYASMTKKDSSVRNMTWALAVIMAFVVVLALLFFGVGNDPDRSVPETSQLDVGESAQRAAAVAPFPVAVPELGEGWTPRVAEFADGDVPTWELRYTSPSGSLVTLVEATEIDAALLSSEVPGAAVQGETDVEGISCQQLSTPAAAEEAASIALSCQADGWGILVHGGEDEADLEALAGAAITSAQA